MAKSAMKMTQRDYDLLVDIYKHRFLSISQIERLHFPSLQTAYRRMRILKTAGLVTAFGVANIEESIFTLSGKGLQGVAAALGVEREELKWQDTSTKPRDYYFMRHFLAINDFRITLRKSCLKAGVSLLGFIPDYYGERPERGAVEKYIKDVIFDKGARKEAVSHTPDGVFALERAGKSALFFLEIDRGTEVVSDKTSGVLKTMGFYAQNLLDGKYKRYAKDFGNRDFNGFRVLFVTTTDVRVSNIRNACDKLDVDPRTKQFLWMTTIEKVSPESIFGEIWRSADSTDTNQYRILR